MSEIAASRMRIVVLLLSLFLWQCDTQKFIDFDYDARQLARAVTVSGTVTNIFTNEPVSLAQLSFEGQLTLTDERGKYDDSYILSVDDNANRPVPVTITADKFFPFDTSLVVFPLDNVLNARLTYAAPIVLSGFLDEDTIANAVIFDYQGTGNIDSVFVLGWYEPTNSSRLPFYREFPMEFSRVIDANSAEYLLDMPVIIQFGILKPGRIRFRVVDRDGYEEDTIFFF